MRYVRAREEHKCVVCNELIYEGEICIQSHVGRCFYHDDCHTERFGNSSIHMPINTIKEVEEKD